MKNIYLVGFMATGKTSAGKELAARLNKSFVDLDSVIEKKEGLRIVDIFAEKGEHYFRRLEKEIVKATSLNKDLIVACGGGVMIDTDNLNTLRQSGIIICLKADIETILERSQSTGQRPLLNVDNPKQRIEELLRKREPFYNQADYSLDTTKLEIKEVVDKIIEIISQNKNKL